MMHSQLGSICLQAYLKLTPQGGGGLSERKHLQHATDDSRPDKPNESLQSFALGGLCFQSHNHTAANNGLAMAAWTSLRRSSSSDYSNYFLNLLHHGVSSCGGVAWWPEAKKQIQDEFGSLRFFNTSRSSSGLDFLDLTIAK